MTTPRDEQLATMDGWPGGVNNRIRETETGVGREGQALPTSLFLRKALNVDLTAEGTPMRRQGYTLESAGVAHSLWSADRFGVLLWVHDGVLMATRSTPAEAVAIRTVSKYRAMSYCEGPSEIYFSNGVELGALTQTLALREWGLPVPPQPVVSGPAAGNPNGWDETRQVSLVYVSTTGAEGGASEPVLVGADGAFTVTVPTPLPAGVGAVRLYVSRPNGEILYAVRDSAGGAEVVHPSDVGRGKELDTQDLFPPKAGHIVRWYNGRVYVARNDWVGFSEPLRPHLMRPSQGIYMFPGSPTLLEPVDDGVFVGYEGGVVFLSGLDPYDVQQRVVAPYSPVPGAATTIPGVHLGVEQDVVPVWWMRNGAMVGGLNGGQLVQLTYDRLAVPEFGAGAISLRQREGMAQVVSSLRRGGDDNTMGATDTVVAEVRRNNVVLNQ